MHQDGSVSAWGDDGTHNNGGDAPAIVGASRTSNVIGIASSFEDYYPGYGAFAALHECKPPKIC
jgi:hypothetical protein